jgi:NitT/TauT family transport system substrate-binding protein
LSAPCEQALASVTLGVVNWIGYGPIYCATANGYYKKNGADVRLVTFSDNSVMAGALRGGELDASTLTYDQVIIADAKGWGLKVVMPLDYSVGGDAILASAAVHDVQDLKGRKVAFQTLSPSDFLLGYALAQRGLSQKDLQPVNVTPEAVVATMATGAVDAGVTYQPSVSMILKLGGGKRHDHRCVGCPGQHDSSQSRAGRGVDPWNHGGTCFYAQGARQGGCHHRQDARYQCSGCAGTTAQRRESPAGPVE